MAAATNAIWLRLANSQQRKPPHVGIIDDAPMWGTFRKALQIAAPLLGIRLISIEARRSGDFDAAFAKIESEQAEAVLTTNDPLHQRNIKQIIEFATRARVPCGRRSTDTGA